MHDLTFEDSWDKKRIIIGVVILVSLVFIGYNARSFFEKSKILTGVKGESIKREKIDTSKLVSSPNIKKDLEQRLDSVKKQVNSLDVGDLASSSPQVKKLIDDLQALQQLPRSQAKEACYNICKGL